MQTRDASILILIASLSLLASGCLDGAGKAGFEGPQGVPLAAPNQTGKGNTPVTIRVVQERAEGDPIPGAAVVIYTIDKPATAPTVQQLLRSNTTLGGRTDAEGNLVARLDRGATYTIVAAQTNWTTEARHLVKITDAQRDKPILLTLFSTSRTAEVSGSIPTTAKFDFPVIRVSGSLASPPLWFPVEVKFHEDAHSNRQYVYRLATAQSKLTWTVDPGEYAELGLRVGFLAEKEPQPRVYWEINRASGTVPVGSFEETLALEAPALAHGDTLKNPRFAVGPYTTEGILAPSGMKWKITVDATFTTDPVTLGPRPYMPSYALPGPGMPLLLLGVALLAWMIRR